VRILGTDGRLDPTPWVEFPNVVRLEDGLLGLALHPDFANQPWVYLHYTVQKGEALVNRVSRFREVNGRAGEEEILIDDLDSNRIHNGGRLRFGPDGMLYISIGELSDPVRAQDLNRLQGKILRITPEGEIPADNPFPGSPIWAYGLRNPHGLTFRPSDGTLFVADNGPTGEWRPLPIGARDEISPVPKGGNLGWPLAVGAPGHPDYVDPIIAWIPAQAPGDLAFYNADLFPELKGNLLFTSLAGQVFMRFTVGNEQNPNAVTSVEWWFHTGVARESTYGRLRAMTVGPDGAIYVGTSNFGRGTAREGDDRILRITPAPQP
jgi:quinoprotein glucose dehydrogenase